MKTSQRIGGIIAIAGLLSVGAICSHHYGGRSYRPTKDEMQMMRATNPGVSERKLEAIFLENPDSIKRETWLYFHGMIPNEPNFEDSIPASQKVSKSTHKNAGKKRDVCECEKSGDRFDALYDAAWMGYCETFNVDPLNPTEDQENYYLDCWVGTDDCDSTAEEWAKKEYGVILNNVSK